MPDIRCEIPHHRRMRADQPHRPRGAGRWSTKTESGVVAGSSSRLNAAQVLCITDHVCACAAASPARYRASSSLKAASMSSGSKRRRHDPVVGIDLDDAEHLNGELTRAEVAIRGTDTTEGKALPAGRDDGRRMSVARPLPRPACSRSLASRPRKTPAFTTRRRSSCTDTRRRAIRPSRPVAGCEGVPKSVRSTWLAAFSSRRACGCSSSKRASAASRSASSNSSTAADQVAFDGERLIIRHSASKPSCEVPFSAWVTTAPSSLSRCTASMWMLTSEVRSQTCTMMRLRSTRLDRCDRPVVEVNRI